MRKIFSLLLILSFLSAPLFSYQVDKGKKVKTQVLYLIEDAEFSSKEKLENITQVIKKPIQMINFDSTEDIVILIFLQDVIQAFI